MEPYTPIPNSILGSTIWLEPPYVRVVWLTMLFTSLRDGRVLASVPGLANLAHVTVAECRDALSRLASPDPDSRTKDHEGRRIEPVDGGWQIYNRAKHRAAMGLDKGLSTPRVRKHRNARETFRNGETPRNAHQDQDQDQDQDQKSPDNSSRDMSGTQQPTSPILDRPGQDSNARLPPQNRPEKRPKTSQATTPATPPPETRPETITEDELKRRCREEPTRDLHSRAAQCVANPYDGLFERPETWPEVQAMAYAFACVYGARYRHLGKIPQHKGLMTLLAILGAGVTHVDYMRAVNLSTEDEWFSKLKGPSLTTLSLDVVLRLLAEADERGAA